MRKTTEAAFRVFQSKVNERLEGLRAAFELLEGAILSVDRQNFENYAHNFTVKADSVREILPSEDWPGWLNNLSNATRNFAAKKDQPKFAIALVKALIRSKDSIESYNWEFEPEETGYPDVSAILDSEIEEKSVNEKFEDLISCLREVIGSPDLNKQQAHSDLLTVVAMLRKAMRSGYSEKIVTWNFVKKFVPNVLIEIGKSTPGVGQCLKAFEKTAEELDISFDEIKNDASARFFKEIERTMISKAAKDVSLLQLPDFSQASAGGE